MTTIGIGVEFAAAMMRATGLIRSFIANDGDHIKAVLMTPADEDTVSKTFAALVSVAALLAVDLAWTGVSGDVDQTLDDVQRRLISGDITRPEVT
jgi:ribosome biogenesis protein Tsr3